MKTSDRIKQRIAEARLRQAELRVKCRNIQAISSVLTPNSRVVEKFREASKGKYIRWRNVNGFTNIE